MIIFLFFCRFERKRCFYLLTENTEYSEYLLFSLCSLKKKEFGQNCNIYIYTAHTIPNVLWWFVYDVRNEVSTILKKKRKWIQVESWTRFENTKIYTSIYEYILCAPANTHTHTDLAKHSPRTKLPRNTHNQHILCPLLSFY